MKIYVLIVLSVLFLLWRDAMACGYPIEIHHRTSGKLLDWFANPPSRFELPTDACIARNEVDCNKNRMLFSLGAGKLLFNNADYFCSDEDRARLRSLYVSLHFWALAVLGLSLGCFLWLVKKIRYTKSTDDITTGSS